MVELYLLYALLFILLTSILFIFFYKQEKNRIIIIPRGKMYSITTYANGLLSNMQLVSSRVINQWFDSIRKDILLVKEGNEYDIESGKLIDKPKKKPGRPKGSKNKKGKI